MILFLCITSVGNMSNSINFAVLAEFSCGITIRDTSADKRARRLRLPNPMSHGQPALPRRSVEFHDHLHFPIEMGGANICDAINQRCSDRKSVAHRFMRLSIAASLLYSSAHENPELAPAGKRAYRLTLRTAEKAENRSLRLSYIFRPNQPKEIRYPAPMSIDFKSVQCADEYRHTRQA
jgi:hypothetical protein